MSARPALRLATSIMADAHIRALTARHPIKPTSPRCPSAWQPKPGRRPTYRRGKSVQTTGTTSFPYHRERNRYSLPTLMSIFLEFRAADADRLPSLPLLS